MNYIIKTRLLLHSFFYIFLRTTRDKESLLDILPQILEGSPGGGGFWTPKSWLGARELHGIRSIRVTSETRPIASAS
jgi:hypothetical protein